MKELEAIGKLAPKWRTAAWAWEHRQNFGKGPSECADELEALLPALEAAYADLRNFNSASVLLTIVNELRDEIAALQEPMSCGHPKACWQATKPDSVDAVVGYRCVACEDKRLAVAAVLRPVAEEMHIQMNGSGLRPSGYGNCRNHGFDDCTSLKCLSAKTGGKALDAHDAAVWNEALEEAAVIGDNYGREGDRFSKEYACETADEIASRIRALKREKRGGE